MIGTSHQTAEGRTATLRRVGKQTVTTCDGEHDGLIEGTHSRIIRTANGDVRLDLCDTHDKVVTGIEQQLERWGERGQPVRKPPGSLHRGQTPDGAAIRAWAREELGMAMSDHGRISDDLRSRWMAWVAAGSPQPSTAPPTPANGIDREQLRRALTSVSQGR